MSATRGRAFVRALIATRYVLGARGEALESGLGALAAEDAAARDELMAELAEGGRRERARVLAGEMGRVVRALASERIR